MISFFSINSAFLYSKEFIILFTIRRFGILGLLLMLEDTRLAR